MFSRQSLARIHAGGGVPPLTSLQRPGQAGGGGGGGGPLRQPLNAHRAAHLGGGQAEGGGLLGVRHHVSFPKKCFFSLVELENCSPSRYEGKARAILRRPEFFPHRKEERCARTFGTTNPGHPAIKVLNCFASRILSCYCCIYFAAGHCTVPGYSIFKMLPFPPRCCCC